MNSKKFLLIAVIGALAGCTSSTVIPLSKNQFILDTSAAPACGASGAAKVAVQMAAIETIRSGSERFKVVGVASDNDVRVVQTAPTGALTTSNYNVYGNSVSGNSSTTFTGGGPIVLGGYNQKLAVQTFRRGDSGFSDAVDAKTTLGTDWQEKVKKGVRTCS